MAQDRAPILVADGIAHHDANRHVRALTGTPCRCASAIAPQQPRRLLPLLMPCHLAHQSRDAQVAHVHHGAVAAAAASVSRPACSAATPAGAVLTALGALSPRGHSPGSQRQECRSPAPGTGATPDRPEPSRRSLRILGGAKCAFPTGPMHPPYRFPKGALCTYPIGAMHPPTGTSPGIQVFANLPLQWGCTPHFSYESPPVNLRPPSPDSCTRP